MKLDLSKRFKASQERLLPKKEESPIVVWLRYKEAELALEMHNRMSLLLWEK